MRSRLPFVALHLVLIASMLMAGFAAPMQAIAAGFAAATTATQPMPGMPCDHMQAMAGGAMASHGMDAPAPHRDAPGDACASAHCSLGACLGIAYLQEIPQLAMQAPRGDAPAAWMPIPRLARMLETPLRPPIG